MNYNRSFVLRNFAHLLCIGLLIVSCRHGTAFCFSKATDDGPVQGLPYGLIKTQSQERFVTDDCQVPRPSYSSLFGNRTHSIMVPTSKQSEEITRIVLHKVKETVGHSGTLTSIRMVAEQLIKQLERVSERTFERMGERTTERTIQRATERTLERMTERAYERVNERTIKRLGERAVERTGERVLERTGERALERVGERLWERSGERALERVGERIVDQVGKKALIKQSEKKIVARSIMKVRRTLLGKSFGRSAIRIGHTLTIALPFLGGLFALYLFQSDVRRIQEERLMQLSPPIPTGKEKRQEQQSLNMIAVSAFILLVSTGLCDLLDAVVHFWIACGLLIQSHADNSCHHLMEQISFYCVIISTLCAVFGEICSYLSRKSMDNHQSIAK